MTARPPSPENLATLGCDWTKRPAGAPGLPDLAPAVRAVARDGATLVVALDPAAIQTARAVAEAERCCCAGLGWEVRETPAVELRITGSDEQLAVLAAAVGGGWPAA